MNQQSVPDRGELLEILRSANQNTWGWVATRLVGIIALAYFIDWQAAVRAPIVSVTACLVILGPFLMGLAQIWGQKKKRIEDIKESTRFGELDKHKLKFLYQETLKRLKLPVPGPPVYVTSDKSLNAGAFRLTNFITGLNGIFLNRQVLHKLRGEEVQAIMGHELGHYYRFNLAGDRFQVLTAALGALVGLFVVQKVQLNGFLGLIVLSAISSGFWVINNQYRYKFGQTIEFLCDDLGAQVQGVEQSISGLLKVGLDAEVRSLIYLEVMALNLKNEMLSPDDIAAAIERATPYGYAGEEELHRSIGNEIKNKQRANQKASVAGFLKYMWESDYEEEDEEELQARLELQARMINQIERHEWESILDDPVDIRLSKRQAEQLVQMIENDPGKHLFRVPEMLGEGDGVHPPLEQRILYLWKNRSHQEELLV